MAATVPSLTRPRPDWRRKLLWVDGLAGATVGLVVLSLHGWLAEVYGLPRDFVFRGGVANLAYGTYSLTLASRRRRPRSLIIVLVVANLTWAVLSVRWAVVHAGQATPWGLAHFLGEAVFVGVLGCLEWRYRELLLRRA